MSAFARYSYTGSHKQYEIRGADFVRKAGNVAENAKNRFFRPLGPFRSGAVDRKCGEQILKTSPTPLHRILAHDSLCKMLGMFIRITVRQQLTEIALLLVLNSMLFFPPASNGRPGPLAQNHVAERDQFLIISSLPGGEKMRE